MKKKWRGVDGEGAKKNRFAQTQIEPWKKKNLAMEP